MPRDLGPGYRVGGRYRLEAELGRGASSVAWRAVDERLERPVAVRIFGDQLDRELLERRAGQAASLTHPRVVRVFDTGMENGRYFTVSELVPGCLSWARLPLQPAEVVAIGAQVAEALHYAHERGIAHGNLHMGNVMLAEGGAKVGDFALAGSPQPKDAQPEADLRALGDLLSRTLTGRDPAAPGPDGRPPADDPPGLAGIVRRLQQGGYGQAAEAMEDLRSLRQAPPPPERRRPITPVIVAVAALLVALAAFGLTRLGTRSPSERNEPGQPITGTPYAISSVDDFDPLGGGDENPGTVRNAIDDQLSTFWSTEGYRSGPNFEGIARKTGVGLKVDLGRAVEVGAAQIIFPAAGCSVEIRYSEDDAGSIDGWTVARSQSNAPESSALRWTPTSSRHWLVWITKLTEDVPGKAGRFACAISEVDLFPRG
jgi:eukaryotic-like serine/threonine-protein kinase